MKPVNEMVCQCRREAAAVLYKVLSGRGVSETQVPEFVQAEKETKCDYWGLEVDEGRVDPMREIPDAYPLCMRIRQERGWVKLAAGTYLIFPARDDLQMTKGQ